LSVGTLAEKYPSLNPYVYVANNPLNFFDTNRRAVFSGSTVLRELSAAELTYLSLGEIGSAAIMANSDGLIYGFPALTGNRIMEIPKLRLTHSNREVIFSITFKYYF